MAWELTVTQLDDDSCDLDDDDREELARLILAGCTWGRLDKDDTPDEIEDDERTSSRQSIADRENGSLL